MFPGFFLIEQALWFCALISRLFDKARKLNCVPEKLDTMKLNVFSPVKNSYET